MNYESLCKYKVGIYIKFHHMLRGKIVEKSKKPWGAGPSLPPPDVTRVKKKLIKDFLDSSVHSLEKEHSR